ncbi:hypothetical protein PGT21_050368 [Puccinia graminis f. sp. tritici]|uniref:Uncharacterized protein n=4 Tax=Puccinia graminis f. sp. tritici TaxID=56615 RepID=A0A5B0Q1R6_PUCGR|nr:hypothetical protein PGT21_050368 [Puccinia graminis f. sp. tritici]
MEDENETMDKSEWFFPHNLKKIEGRPPIYSQNRQELCEALPYFRSYQSGCYVSDQRATGYLLDGFPAPRDVFEDSGRVVISHAGGGSIISRLEGSKAPKLTLARSQDRESAPVRELLKCKHECVPVALIAGVKYAGMPWIRKYDSVRYAVLGHYLVTHSWPELESIGEPSNVRRFRFKFRFQWVSSQGDPWWLSDLEEYFKSMKPQSANACGRLSPSLSDDKRHQATSKMDGEPNSINRIDSSDRDMMELSDEEPVTYQCNACGRHSLNIYKDCWMCLNETCIHFFRTNESNGPSQTEEKMHYVWWFLKHQQSFETETRVPFSLTPKTLQKLRGTQLEFEANQEPKTGFYCSSCGRLSIRIYWGSLVCSNEECQVGPFVVIGCGIKCAHGPSLSTLANLERNT